MRIKKGDTVQILTGKDKGKTGKVLSVFPSRERVVVEGLNILKKHRKPRKQGEKGQIVEMASPMQISNVSLVCPNCNKTTRVGYGTEGDTKRRMCKKCRTSI